MRIMIDTNVLISIILFPSARMNEVKTKLSKDHRIVICSYVIDELKTVISRKFPHKLKALDEFFTQLPFELVYTPYRIILTIIYTFLKKAHSMILKPLQSISTSIRLLRNFSY